MKMNSAKLSVALGAALLMAGCASPISKDAKQALKKPIDCRTARHDVTHLPMEKALNLDRLKAGVTSVTPIGLVLGVVSGSQGDKIKVTTGKYNEMIENKIAEIRRTCKV